MRVWEDKHLLIALLFGLWCCLPWWRWWLPPKHVWLQLDCISTCTVLHQLADVRGTNNTVKSHPFASCWTAPWVSRVTAPLFLVLVTNWVGVVSFTHWPLCSHGKGYRYPLNRRLGGPQRRFWRSDEEKGVLSLREVESRLLIPSVSIQHWMSTIRAVDTLLYKT